MHKLMEYICDELEQLERKADKDGKLTMQEIQYGDTLAHFKKNLLKAEEMEDDDYSGRMSYEDRMYPRDMYRGGSYARGRRNARRDSMGRYSSKNDMLIGELHELMEDAPDEHTKMEFKKFIEKMERM